MKKSSILILIFSWSALVSQKTTDIKVRQGDEFIFSSVLNNDKSHINLHTVYHWYADQQIRNNRGGYYGKLLQGEYKRFDKANRLVESGCMRRGKKIGKWICWDKNGEFEVISNWRNGKESGQWSYFNEEGKLDRVLNYRRGRIASVKSKSPAKCKWISKLKWKKLEEQGSGLLQ